MFVVFWWLEKWKIHDKTYHNRQRTNGIAHRNFPHIEQIVIFHFSTLVGFILHWLYSSERISVIIWYFLVGENTTQRIDAARSRGIIFRGSDKKRFHVLPVTNEISWTLLITGISNKLQFLWRDERQPRFFGTTLRKGGRKKQSWSVKIKLPRETRNYFPRGRKACSEVSTL